MLDVTVITPSIPERSALLCEAIQSVHRQTMAPREHLIHVEQTPAGIHPMVHLIEQRNRLAAACLTEWVATLDDDDLYLRGHFETISAAMQGDADVIYTAPLELSLSPFPADVGQFDFQNFVTSNACIRRRSLLEIGGWSADGFDPETHRYEGLHVTAEDWHLWRRMARAGMKFVGIPRQTWHYRRGDWHRLTEDIGDA